MGAAGLACDGAALAVSQLDGEAHPLVQLRKGVAEPREGEGAEARGVAQLQQDRLGSLRPATRDKLDSLALKHLTHPPDRTEPLVVRLKKEAYRSSFIHGVRARLKTFNAASERTVLRVSESWSKVTQCAHRTWRRSVRVNALSVASQ
eukprot:5155357-Pleurochrysis_carterae.AAC.3